jgi:sugar phosphate isomerase/epimerase
MSELHRRTFIKNTSIVATGLSLALKSEGAIKKIKSPLFDLSLAQWSLHRSLFNKKMDNLDFAVLTRKHGINAVEYVNQFFKDKANNQDYLKEMKNRADSEGVKSLLIMCDGEGALGAPAENDRMQTVENHKKWVEAAKYLGCHSIRVNGYSSGNLNNDDYYESQKLVADGLHRLCDFADDHDINVIIENHGGHSSHAPWLMGVMRLAMHHRAGTLPDFGNFRISRRKEGEEIFSYDTYRGTAELMPLAKGVSVKTKAWDDYGQQSDLDYEKIMRVVLDAGYRGYCGIEHGEEGREWESIVEVKEKLLICRNWLQAEYND